MKTLVISALMGGVALPALAHGPLDGRWALDLADCAEDLHPPGEAHAG